jgi:hypothetical protein
MELVLNDVIIGVVMGIGITSFLVMIYILAPFLKKRVRNRFKD